MPTVAQPEEIDFIIADLALFTQGEVIALALNVDANLRESPPIGTPVDTGWAKANWVPSVGAPYNGLADDKHPGAAAFAERQAAQEQGTNAVLSWTYDAGPIFVTNNVPYIAALNAGHSTQSPPGFVQAAMELAIKQTYSAGASKAQRTRRADAARAAKPRPKK